MHPMCATRYEFYIILPVFGCSVAWDSYEQKSFYSNFDYFESFGCSANTELAVVTIGYRRRGSVRQKQRNSDFNRRFVRICF